MASPLPEACVLCLWACPWQFGLATSSLVRLPAVVLAGVSASCTPDFLPNVRVLRKLCMSSGLSVHLLLHGIGEVGVHAHFDQRAVQNLRKRT